MNDMTKAKGNPSKGFFINMITRDISLADCVLDLLDNCVDGINNKSTRENVPLPETNKYAGHNVEIIFDVNSFAIQDNCGGIPINSAIEYAFRFGRPDDLILDTTHMIGLYGIGMKRAMFKIGKKIKIESSTGSESFELELDVNQWRTKVPETDWDFDLTNVRQNGTDVPTGTKIIIHDLYPSIKRMFQRPDFLSTLHTCIERDYAFILMHGLKIFANKRQVKAKIPQIKVSDDFRPIKIRRAIDGVNTEIAAGLGASPPSDDSALSKFPDADKYGWYIVCNERVVVSADKTHLTGWGSYPPSAWHPQYLGFIGIVKFDSEEPDLLPWKTTKRDVDTSNAIYQVVLGDMKEVAETFVQYTNKRKSQIAEVRKLEKSATAVPVTELPLSKTFKFPKLIEKKTRRIQYDKAEDEILAVAEALGLKRLALKEVGIRTFDYFRDREVKD